MRKIRIMEHISLDGVIQRSADDGDFRYSDWTVSYRTPDLVQLHADIAVARTRASG